jgi:[lysine-biosynthesis-protein LysW]--L-2-aminoadipate ligase
VEFKALDSCVDFDVPAAIVDWLEEKAAQEAPA